MSANLPLTPCGSDEMASETETPTAAELVQRIDAALTRAEQAAGRVDRRLRAVGDAARNAVAGLDRLIAAEEDKLRG